MSRLLIAGIVIYIIAKKFDVMKVQTPGPSKVVDDYIRDDTEHNIGLYPEDHHVTDHLLKAITGPQEWLAGPQVDGADRELLFYGAEGAGPYAANHPVPYTSLYTQRDESSLLSSWSNK